MFSPSVYFSIVLFLASSALVNCQIDCEYFEEFQDFKVKYNKSYNTKRREHRAYNAFAQHLKHIHEHNDRYAFGEATYYLEANSFSDMTTQQFVKKMNGFKMPSEETRKKYKILDPPLKDVPDQLDWRVRGAVTPVKDQLGCGACWAFSAAEALESNYFIETGKLISLSEQNLMDCTWPFGNRGCDGGAMSNAFDYIIWNKGINSEESYPFIARMGPCRYNKSATSASMIKYSQVKEGNEKSMKIIVAEFGPLAAAIDGSHSSWMHYRGGIYEDKDCRTTHLDHAVAIVGYGIQSGGEYWIVKNSYGTDWGLHGYAWVFRDAQNVCGIATHALLPIVK